jgi:hypothetical protein
MAMSLGQVIGWLLLVLAGGHTEQVPAAKLASAFDVLGTCAAELREALDGGCDDED